MVLCASKMQDHIDSITKHHDAIQVLVPNKQFIETQVSRDDRLHYTYGICP